MQWEEITTQINCKASIRTVIKREYGHKIGLIKLKFTMNKKHCLSLHGENLVVTQNFVNNRLETQNTSKTQGNMFNQNRSSSSLVIFSSERLNALNASNDNWNDCCPQLEGCVTNCVGTSGSCSTFNCTYVIH